MFHLRMNKTIQEIETCMKTLVNVDDELCLGYLRTSLGLQQITNKAESIKRCGQFEKHDQFLLEVGQQILINAFQSYLEQNDGHIDETAEGAHKLILDFLHVMDIKFYYDPKDYEERKRFDDVLSNCRDLAGRTLMSLVSDKVEHEGDGLGIRGVCIAMIPYFLN